LEIPDGAAITGRIWHEGLPGSPRPAHRSGPLVYHSVLPHLSPMAVARDLLVYTASLSVTWQGLGEVEATYVALCYVAYCFVSLILWIICVFIACILGFLLWSAIWCA